MLEFLRESKDKGLPKPNPKQNSEIRAKTAGLRFGIAGALHETFPKLTANGMTYLGLGLKTAGVLVAEWQNVTGNKNKAVRGLALGAVLAGELGDGVDGPLSDIIADETGKRDPNGGHKDVLADRGGEVIHNFMKAFRAHKLGHKYGSKVALVNAFETTLPSAIKAVREAQGYSLPENVRGLRLESGRPFLDKVVYGTTSVLGFLGGRTGRPFLNIPATFFPKAQPILDTVQVVANSYASVERIRYPFDSSHPRDLPENYRKESRFKAKLLTGVLGVSIMVVKGVDQRFKDENK